MSAGLTCEVLIVGAGPAGAVAARVLAAAGRDVVVIDRAALPRYKTCGGGVLSRAAKLAGVSLEGVAERSFDTLQLTLLDSGQTFVARRESPIVFMAMRSALDAALLTAATGAGARVVQAGLLELVQSAESVAVRTTAGEIAARFVIGADGAASATARQAGWPPHRCVAPALEWEIAVDAATLARFSTTPRFDFDIPADGYAWVFPKAGHLSVGVAAARRRSDGAGGGGRATDLNAACAAYLERLGIAPTAAERHGWVIPLRPRAEGLSRHRVLLAGDAAGLADPITLEGISHAVLSGKLAAEAVLAGGGSPERVRRGHAARTEAEILAELRPAAALARLLYGPAAVRTALFRRHGQRLTETLTDVATGKRRYRDLVGSIGTYWKLLGAARGRVG